MRRTCRTLYRGLIPRTIRNITSSGKPLTTPYVRLTCRGDTAYNTWDLHAVHYTENWYRVQYVRRTCSTLYRGGTACNTKYHQSRLALDANIRETYMQYIIQKWYCVQFSLRSLIHFSLEGWENILFEIKQKKDYNSPTRNRQNSLERRNFAFKHAGVLSRQTLGWVLHGVPCTCWQLTSPQYSPMKSFFLQAESM